MTLALSFLYVQPISAENNDSEELITSVTSTVFTFEELQSNTKVSKTIETPEGEVTITIKPAVSASNRETFLPGTYDRVVTVEKGIYFKLTAAFRFSINPYLTSITRIGNGTFSGIVGTWIKNDYIFIRANGDRTNPAHGRYLATYTTYVGGTLGEWLDLKVYPSGNGGYITASTSIK